MKIAGIEIFPMAIGFPADSPKSQYLTFETIDGSTSITTFHPPMKPAFVKSVKGLTLSQKDAQKVFERVLKYAEKAYIETAIRFAIRNEQTRLAYDFADLISTDENVIVLRNRKSYYVKMLHDGKWIQVLKITRHGNYKVHKDFRLKLIIASKKIYYSVYQ